MKACTDEPVLPLTSGKLHLNLDGTDPMIRHTDDHYLYVTTVLPHESKISSLFYIIDRVTLKQVDCLEEDGLVYSATSAPKTDGTRFVVISVKE
mmetsp:Transcript_34052/g.42027  ORF Transcript_34052/g.42027 Transcript_34052/m.42027 type:complete len:94 (+) Transcript_34052:246-527(+)